MKAEDTIWVSEHFTTKECIKSSTALRMGISNVPNEQELASMKLTAINLLEPPRNHFGIPFSPSSFFRCILLNRAIGSKDSSQHVKGEAVDYEIPGIDNLELARWVRANCSFDQLILEFYDGVDPTSGWLHGSYVSEELNRGEVLTYYNSAYSIGLPGD